MFVSYAQNFEDVMLRRALRHVARGFYIDIGAQDPLVDSVSLCFYEMGWRGLHVEPTAAFAAKLRAARPDEEVIEATVSAGGENCTFYEIPDTGLSTGSSTIAKQHARKGFEVRAKQVRCIRLSEILDRYQDREIHWLKIDVEGMEPEVIRSWQPSAVRPWIVVVESTVPRTSEQNFASWAPMLESLGYEFVYFDGLNRFYVHRSHLELKHSFASGPNVFDDFALSGAATAPFCRKLNTELSQLSARNAELLRVIEAMRAEAGSEKAAFMRTDTATPVMSGVYLFTSRRIAEPLRRVSRIAKRILNRIVSLMEIRILSTFKRTRPHR
jgi:FkbM family methyltransferase